MSCSCDVPPIPFSAPPALRECAPEGADAAKICPRCLVVEPVEIDDTADAEADEPDFSPLSGAFPDGEAGVALALVIGLCDSLAINRAEIETALEYAERAGADPLLAIDRLLAEPDVKPAIALERRRHQLEQLLF